MKRTRLLAAAVTALFVVPLAVNSQQPGGGGGQGGGGRGGRGGGGGPGGGGGFGGFGGGQGGGGMGGMMGGDPNQFFDMISKGKDVIRRDDLDPMFQRMFDRMAEAQGITNGQITRDQFKTASDSMRNGRGGRNGQGGGAPGGGGPPGRGGEMTPEEIDRRAEDAFRKADKNGDGLLQFEEMPDNLKPNWKNYDSNQDGAIGLDEFKSYYRDRIQIRTQEAKDRGQTLDGKSLTDDGLPPAPEAVAVQEEDQKTVVYRFGKMPKEIPAWFTELDTDKDGQVGLYEWVKSGRSVDDFRAMDRNDDGLLTVEEVLSFTRATTKSRSDDPAVASAGDGRGGPGGMQGGFGRGGGRGGPGGGGMGGGDTAGGMQGGFGRGGGRGGPGGGTQGGGAPGGAPAGADTPATGDAANPAAQGGGRGGRGGQQGGGGGRGGRGGGGQQGGGAPGGNGNAPANAGNTRTNP